MTGRAERFEETVEEELKKANFTGIGEHRSPAVCSCCGLLECLSNKEALVYKIMTIRVVQRRNRSVTSASNSLLGI